MIHNARIQLFAAALNNLGVGAIIAGIVAPMINGTLGGGHLVAWVVVGAELLVAGQLVLGRLQ